MEKYKYADFVLTVLVLRYLGQRKEGKFMLILKKAREWVKRKGKEVGVGEEAVQEIGEVVEV